MDQLIAPNWHVLFLHFPIALLLGGIVGELFGLGKDRPTIRIFARGMIGLGAILAIPTAVSGMFALRDVVTPGPIQLHHTWAQVVAENDWSPQTWEYVERHVWLNGAAVVLANLVVLFWLGRAPERRAALHIPLLLVLLAAVGCMVVGSWYGGEMVYRHGVAVGDTGGAGSDWPVPPLQTHVVAAGLTMAFALAALASSAARRAARGLWALGLLVGLATVFFGFVTVVGTELSLEKLENNLRYIAREEHRRLLAHVIAGTTILAVTLAGVALAGPIARRGALRGLTGLVLLGATGLQVWFGTLLLFDSHEGPLTGFVAAPAPVETEPPAEPEEAPPPENLARAGNVAQDEPPRADTEPPRATEASSPASEADDEAEPEESDAAAVVKMTDSLTYEPREVTVRVGQSVRWTNPSSVEHTVTADAAKASDAQNVRLPQGAESFDSGTIEPGGEWTYTFTAPGLYRYFCIPDEIAGMVGEVRVER